MRIAHIVCSYPPYYSGMGNIVLETVSELKNLGHEVVVFTPMYKDISTEEEFTPEMQEKIDYAKRLKPTIEYGKAARLSQIHRELEDYDLVHLHYPFYGTANLVRNWKQKNPDKPLVITYHMDTRGTGWKGLIFKYYSKYWMPRILGVADMLIGSSFDYIEASDAAPLLKEDPDKWVDLPFGVDINRFQPRAKPEDLFVKHNLDSGIPTLLFVGGMDIPHYFKGIPVFLDSLLQLKKNDIVPQVVFVGDGELREKFELRVSSFGLKKSVRFVGKASYEELPRYYNMADLFVLPSIHKGEAFGTVLLEAMASGVPVLASDLPGVRTVANKGGMVFAPSASGELAEQIAGFFLEETDREIWKETVREVATKEYAWQPIVKRLEGLYNSLV